MTIAHSTPHALGTTLLRLIVGTTFIAHGSQKLFSFGVAGTAGFLGCLGVPMANVMAPVLIATELGGGILLVLGLLTRYVSHPARVHDAGGDRDRAPAARLLPAAGL